MKKFSNHETFDETDWINIVDLSFTFGQWLIENTNIEVVQEVSPKKRKTKE